jgi:ElaB/YqjD/DUF883 family membrane-anchored ribosome-binding protein
MTDTISSIADTLPISEDQKQQISDKAGQVTNQLQAQITSQVGTRAAQWGDQASTIAGALRTTGQDLGDQGQDAPAKVVNMAADRVDRLGQYLSYSDPNQILNDIEDLCRQQPWVVIAGGIALGFLGARFLKASSSRRYSREYPSPNGYTPQYGQRYRGGI